jgi:hypothetical protein
MTWDAGVKREAVVPHPLPPFIFLCSLLFWPGFAGQMAFCKYYDNLRLMRSQVAKQIMGAALVYNCLNCLVPGAISHRFKVKPPLLEEYLDSELLDEIRD